MRSRAVRRPESLLLTRINVVWRPAIARTASGPQESVEVRNVLSHTRRSAQMHATGSCRIKVEGAPQAGSRFERDRRFDELPLGGSSRAMLLLARAWLPVALRTDSIGVAHTPLEAPSHS